MKTPNKRKSKIVVTALSVIMTLSLLAVQASAFVNVTPSGNGNVYYAINPIADINVPLVATDYSGAVKQVPSHISVIGAGTSGGGSTSGLITSGRPGSNITDIAGLYRVEMNSSRLWTVLGKDFSLNPSTLYDNLEGVAIDVSVRFDTYVIEKNMSSELNFDLLTEIYQSAEVDVLSSYSGEVLYPKKDGSLANLYFSLSFENSYNLSSAPDGTQSNHIKVRHFTSPTPLYPNQNPNYINHNEIYENAYSRLDETLKEQFFEPEVIQRWVTEERETFSPVCSNYVSTYTMNLKSTDKPILSDRLVVGSFSATNTWVGTYGNYVDMNSALASFKATASKYDFTEVITNAINNTMNIQIFPDFTVGEIFLIVGGLGILTLLLKIFLGG